MQDRQDLKKIYILLLVGGAIVATVFIVGGIFGSATWTDWWIANVLHLIGGFYAFFFVRACYQYTKSKHQISAPLLSEIMIFIAGALIMGVFWEWYELMVDRYHVFILGEPSIMTYADNVGDLVIDFLGAIAAGIYLWKRRPKQDFELGKLISPRSSTEVVS